MSGGGAGRDRARTWWASAFGLGLSPVLPGTCGALLGLALHGAAAAWLSVAGVAVVLGAGLAVSVVFNGLLEPFAVRRWGDADPAQFVWDEVAGYLATALLTVGLPFLPWGPAGFVAFRVLDMIKVWPASWIDRRWHGATGILVDDLVSAVYAAGLIWGVWAVGG